MKPDSRDRHIGLRLERDEVTGDYWLLATSTLLTWVAIQLNQAPLAKVQSPPVSQSADRLV
ncbi:MAG: hypothetical protein Q7S04_04840 [Candidatus Moranbacteria bacterium]|nr:hypothetical protein [Candidatus Moranbacteria bacterium]